MANKREMVIANFNCTYGDDNLPMLEYFDEILYPAFTSNIKRVTEDKDEYFFEQVRLIEYMENEFAITGLFIKRTIIEVKSGYDDDNGLTHKDINIPTAPYSLFVIFLNNHRMLLIKNQRRESPDIRSFSATAKTIINQVVKKYNKERSKEEKLPYPFLNIASIPSKETIESQLENVKNINSITLRFYPLNGDVDTSAVLMHLRSQLDILKSKTGNTVINSPKDKKEVIDFIEDTKGNAIPSLKVSYNNGDSRTIKSDEFAEKINVVLNEENLSIESTTEVINKVINRKEIQEVSEDNKVIYLDKFQSIKNKWKDGGK
jgi:hypothetical protein